MKYFLFTFGLLLSMVWSNLAAAEASLFFSYSTEELNALQATTSELLINIDDLKKWDYIAERAAEEAGFDFYDRNRLFTYLYVAQAEAFHLSHKMQGGPAGSLDPISEQILNFFVTKFPKPQRFQTDHFSQLLADMIAPKIKQRMEQEAASKIAYDAPEEAEKHFALDISVAKWIPWLAKPSMAFWPPAPPAKNDPFWKEQIAALKKAQNPMTEAKKDLVYRWAGLSYHLSDDWRSIANLYLFCHNVPLQKMLKVRAAIMISLYDSIIAYMDCKYRYLVPRPKTFDPTIVYLVPAPKDPSYPSGRASEAGAIATVMTHFFPQDDDYWIRITFQCRIARIWAGIHFPIDEQAGRQLGENVAQKVLKYNLY